MFVILCLSVCFRNVGCWHVPVLGPVAFAQGSKKKIDQEASSRAEFALRSFPAFCALLGKPASDQQVSDLAGHPSLLNFSGFQCFALGGKF